jgi:hypothetical protein
MTLAGDPIQPGGCPRIDISSQIEAFRKNKHSHMFDIGVFAYLRALFFRNNEELRIKGILGQPPRHLYPLEFFRGKSKKKMKVSDASLFSIGFFHHNGKAHVDK